MRNPLLLLALIVPTACASPRAGPEPSLAPRAAEAIDPRLPIPSVVPAGPADAALSTRLAELVGEVRAGVAAFQSLQARAERLAAGAGPMASESWVAAQQALSRLVEQYGVTTRAAANIDQLASNRLQGQRWIQPADQQAIAAAAGEVAAISNQQADAINRLTDQLAR